MNQCVSGGGTRSLEFGPLGAFRAAMRRYLVICVLALCADARAETPTGGAGSGSATGDIAPPAPDAPPDKVKEAKEVAAKAELTPITPSPKNPTRPAFQLYAEIDLPIVSIGLVYMLGRRIKQQPAYCAPSCDNVDINWLDAHTAGFYSEGWSLASDIELWTLGAGTAGLLLADEGLVPALNDSVVIAESMISASAVATIMTFAAGRPRPFLYGDAAPLSVRNSGDAALSFLSSHTADAFAISTSLYMAQRRLHPTSNRPTYVLAGGYALSSLVGLSRVMAGKHFITDALGGAVVGASVGFIVSGLHRSPVKVVPVVNRDATNHVTSGGLGVAGSF